MSSGNFRPPSTAYATSYNRQPQPYLEPPPAYSAVPHPVSSSLYQDPLNGNLCYPDHSPHPTAPSQREFDSSYRAPFSSYPPYDQGRYNEYPDSVRVGSDRNDVSPSQGNWYPTTVQPLAPVVAPLVEYNPQPSFSSRLNQELGGGRGEPTKRPQGPSPRRPTLDDFRNLVLSPCDDEELLKGYVGTDSKYTLAQNHAGIMVRSSIKSQQVADKMREVAEPLSSINNFLELLLAHRGIKPEHKGCLALRICFGALTSLLGDSSQSDSHGAVVPGEYFAQPESSNLRVILSQLAWKLERSLNMYRHRRSPSASLVAKFQQMSKTLHFWNQCLGDDTFIAPYQVASQWLQNHPSQARSKFTSR